jgi:phosphatidylglycerol:prolipoprotein diacylglycerol transferase
MYPVLFKLGPVTLYSFGLMMALAFLVANYLFTQELKRRNMDERIASAITMIALVAGVGGSKLFSLLENWSDFTADPVHQLLSPSGLTFYGGFLLSTLIIYLYLRRKKIRFLLFADMIAPTVFLAYGIGRIGCQLAGDGDYGIPSRLPWAMAYPQGTAKPAATLFEYFVKFPSERLAWHYDSLVSIPRGVDQLGGRISRFDEVTTLHPAPAYETIFCFIAFYLIWKQREKFQDQLGKIFSITLVAMGVERLLVEFIRLNPLYLGLSMAQWISVAMIIVGGYALLVVFPKQEREAKLNVVAE